MSLQEFLLNLDSLDPNFDNEYQKIYRQVHRQQLFVYDKAQYSSLSKENIKPFREFMSSNQ